MTLWEGLVAGKGLVACWEGLDACGLWTGPAPPTMTPPALHGLQGRVTQTTREGLCVCGGHDVWGGRNRTDRTGGSVTVRRGGMQSTD